MTKTELKDSITSQRKELVMDYINKTGLDFGISKMAVFHS